MAPSDHPAFSPQKLKARLREAAEERVAFAFGIDKSGKEPVLLLHNKLSGKPLLQFLKSKNEVIVLGTFGEAKLEGKRLYLYAEKNLKSFVKLGKLWTNANKHPMITKIIPIVGGNELGEDADEDATLDDPSMTVAGDQDNIQAPEQMLIYSKALKKALQNAAGKIDSAKLDAAGAQVNAAISVGNFKLAKKIIVALGAVKTSDQAVRPQSSVDFGKLADDWIAARKNAERDIASLRDTALKNYPHLAEQLSTLDSTFKPFNRELGRTLSAAKLSKDPAQCHKLSARAAAIAQDYQTALRIDPLVAHIAKNPFKKIDLVARMSVPLQSVVAALK